MAINTTTRQTTAFTSGNNFAFAFKVYEEGDVKVIRITTSTGAEEVLTITTHYTVTLNDDQNANPGGTVTLVNSGNPVNLGSGFNVVITSKVTPLQQTEITNQGGFFPEVINDVLDKAAILDQQQQSILDKTIRFPLTQTVGGLEITENATNRAGKIVQFDSNGDLAILGTVDGRDVSADGAKLDTIESGATQDQTDAEIRTAVENANDSNVFTDADHAKLNAIEDNATRDQTVSEIKGLIAGSPLDHTHLAANSVNTSELVDGSVIESKLAASAVTSGKIQNNAVTSAKIPDGHILQTKIADGAVNGQKISADAITGAKIADDQIDSEHYVDGSIDRQHLAADIVDGTKIADNAISTEHIASGVIDSSKLSGATVITASEQGSATPNDTSFLTSAAADARFFNISSGDTIKDGDTFPDNDTTIATTAAINDRIIDLVEEVGGFVPIANETSFPTANPDINNANNKKGGTIVSVKEASTNLVPNGTTVTIANGRGSGLAVIITGVPSTIPQGFGFLVETTSTDHTYAFHRLSPKATEVTTVAGKAVEIGRLGTADAVADMNLLGTTDVVADMNMLATTDIIADMAMLATTDIIADMALLAVPDVISDMNDLATSANITAMSTCSTNISSINNASSNINSINNFGDTYQVDSNDPQYDGGGNALAEGDLYFNTSAKRLKVYDGSSWVNGVEISSSGAVTTGNTFTGDNRYNDGVKALFGTGSDLQIYHDGFNSYISEAGTGSLIIDSPNTIFQDGKKVVLGTDSDVQIYHDNSHGYIKNSTGNFRIDSDALRLRSLTNNETYLKADYNGGVELYHDDDKRLETDGSGVVVTGRVSATTNISAGTYLYAGGQVYSDELITATQNNSSILLLKSRNASGTEQVLFKGTNGGATELYYDGTKKLETGAGQILISDATVRINHTGNDEKIVLSGSSNPYIEFKEGSTNKAYIQWSSNGYIILYNRETSKDVRIGGSGVEILDNTKFVAGDSQDLQIYHDGSGTNSYIDNNSGHFYLRNHFTNSNNIYFTLKEGKEFGLFKFNTSEWLIKTVVGGATELWFDGSQKLVTTSYGSQIYGDLAVGNSKDMYYDRGIHLSANGTGAVLHLTDNTSGHTKNDGFDVLCHGGHAYLFLREAGTMYFGTDSGNKWELTSTGIFQPSQDSAYDIGQNGRRVRNGYFDTLYGDGSNLTGISSVGGATGVDFNDNVAVRFGTGNDVEIKHTPNHTYLNIINGNFYIQRNGTNVAAFDGGGDFYIADNKILYLGDGADLQLYHASNESWIKNNTGTLNILNDGTAQFKNLADNATIAQFVQGAECSLWYDGDKKLQTTSNGIEVRGKTEIKFSAAGAWSGDGNTKIQHHSSYLWFVGGSNGFIWRHTNGNNLWHMSSAGHLTPQTNGNMDIGASNSRVRNIYTNDLHLSNEGHKNDVDGSWGSYTIQEGAEDLFLINRRNGKKYKFALTEVA